MKPIAFEDFRPAPGRVIEWTISAGTAAAAQATPADPTPLSYNQQLHLASYLALTTAGQPGNPWIGVAFELPGAVDTDALGRAFTAFVQRHDSLRGGFRPTATGIERYTVPADAIALDLTPVRDFDDADTLFAYLTERLAAGTNPFAWPPYVFGVVSRESGSTVYVAMDHTTSDGYSLALVVNDVHELYLAELEGRPADLPATGSFNAHAALEIEKGETMTADDKVVGRWREFIARCGGTGPRFALDLGVAPGQTYDQDVYNTMLLNAEETEAFDQACRAAGGSLFPGLLAAKAIVAREMTGKEDFLSVTPLHTRFKPEWRSSMGWYITCAPLEFSTSDAKGFTDVLAAANTALRGTLGNAKFPASKVVSLLGDDFRPTRRDMFSMVSYIDYRKMPGGEHHAELQPVTLGQTLQADDAHVWASRVAEGLHVAIRYPVTEVSPALIDQYVMRLREVVGRVAVAGDYPIPSAAMHSADV
ncbi:MAG: hypothetical protein JWN54_1370 [Mycobacterium sp.]|nr:hypothetical protein [Mycobacterium sp.]